MKIKSRILGMSFMGTHYSVVVEDKTDKRVKLPIIVTEDSAIEVSSCLNVHQTGKGGTFFRTMFRNINHDIAEVFIHTLEEGKFKVKIIKEDGTYFKANVSNALKIVAASGVDLYIDEDVYKTAGMVVDEAGEIDREADISYSESDGEQVLDSLGELERQMATALEDENYEQAAKLRDVINKIKGDDNQD